MEGTESEEDEEIKNKNLRKRSKRRKSTNVIVDEGLKQPLNSLVDLVSEPPKEETMYFIEYKTLDPSNHEKYTNSIRVDGHNPALLCKVVGEYIENTYFTVGSNENSHLRTTLSLFSKALRDLGKVNAISKGMRLMELYNAALFTTAKELNLSENFIFSLLYGTIDKEGVLHCEQPSELIKFICLFE